MSKKAIKHEKKFMKTGDPVTRDTTFGEILDRDGGVIKGGTDALVLHFKDDKGEFTESVCIVRGTEAEDVMERFFSVLIGEDMGPSRALH